MTDWKFKSTNQLVENIDYYFNEEGLMVLTAKFLKDRGYCCHNQCKHCPYKENQEQDL